MMRLFLNAMVGKECLHFTVQKKRWMRKVIMPCLQTDLELLRNKPPLHTERWFFYAKNQKPAKYAR